jgi:predicted ATP-grasp superfamily ATP-dependent carboligase
VEILVYEYSCCQPLAAGTPAAALRAEGWAMLSAVLHDLARIRGVTAVTVLARDHADVPFPSRRVGPTDEEYVFRELAARADHTLVIAPEFDGLLEARCRWAEEAGGRLLGPGPEAVRLAGDKLTLAGHLARHGISTPPTLALSDVLDRRAVVPFPAVCKPRYGAGSQSTYLARDEGDLRGIHEAEPATEFVVQPHVAGTPASAALLLGPRRCLALPPAFQHLSADGHFHYLGGSAPLPFDLAGRARSLAAAAAGALPGARGYVGVDLVLGEPDGAGDQVIEVNPRLTTSYVGLRALARGNLAEVMLRVARGEEAPPLLWHGGAVTWKADGSVRAAGEADG